MVAKFVVLAALVAIAHAGVVGPHGGTSVSSRQQDDHGNYAFQYQINDGASTHGRAEAGNKAGVVGSYNLGIIDGRKRQVNYVADGHGFRAKVATNEQGTALSAPASAIIASPYTGTAAVGHAPAIAVAPAAAIAPAVAIAPAAAYGAVAAAPAVAYGGYGAVAVAPAAAYGGYGALAAAPATAYGGYGAVAAPVGAYGVAGLGGYGLGAYGAGAHGLGAYGAGAHGLGAYGAGYGIGKHVLG